MYWNNYQTVVLHEIKLNYKCELELIQDFLSIFHIINKISIYSNVMFAYACSKDTCEHLS